MSSYTFKATVGRDSSFTKINNEAGQLEGFEDVKGYARFKEKYWENIGKTKAKTQIGVDKSRKSGIIKEKNETAVNDVHYIGKLDKRIYSCVTTDIASEDVIITEKQVEHIKERHPDVYEKFGNYFNSIIQNPDYIIEANKPDTALILKEISQDNQKFKTVLRLVTSHDAKGLSNSIITFMKIDDKEWNRLLRNKKILYKSE